MSLAGLGALPANMCRHGKDINHDICHFCTDIEKLLNSHAFLHGQVNALQERIAALERPQVKKEALNSLEDLYNRFEGLEKNLESIKEFIESIRKVPLKCPLCEGQGKIWPAHTIGYNNCFPCKGKGIIWG